MIGPGDLGSFVATEPEPAAQAGRYVWGKNVPGRFFSTTTVGQASGPSSCAQPFFRLRFEALVGAMAPFEVAGPKVLGLLRSLPESVPLQAFLALESPDLENPGRLVALLESAMWSRHQVQLFASLAAGVRVRPADLHQDGMGVAAGCSCGGFSRRGPIVIEGAVQAIRL